MLRQLLELAEKRGPKRERSPWHDQVAGYKEEWSNFIEQEKASDAVPIDPRRLIKELRAVAPDDTLMITDTGNHQTWVEQYWDAPSDRMVFTPGGFAGMGFGTYGVLGLKLARPDQPAVCVTSDGSFMMFPGAVATATEYDIPAVWVILNNYTIGVIRDLQRFYMDGREIGTSFVKQSTGEFWNPDFAKMAESMGAGGISVEHPSELGGALETALAGGQAVRRRREGQPRHRGSTDRDLALRADPAGGADVRQATHPQLIEPYPFTAIVGQERLKQALLLNAVNPAVGGVLIEGPSGTGKSTAVRGLAALLPEIDVVADCPFSCDPAAPCGSAASPPRARGGAPCRPPARPRRHVAAQRHRGPGLRVGRHRPRAPGGRSPRSSRGCSRRRTGASSTSTRSTSSTTTSATSSSTQPRSATNVVEREGVSVSHPARFLLVGTMNPEEGELRPQLADRIGLRVVVEAILDAEQRAEVMRRREAYTADPAAFASSARLPRTSWPRRCRRRARRVGAVEVPDYALPGDRAAGRPLGRPQPPRGHDDPREREGAGRARRPRRRDGRRRASTRRVAALPHRLAVDPFDAAAGIDERILRRVLEEVADVSADEKKRRAGRRRRPPGSRDPRRAAGDRRRRRRRTACLRSAATGRPARARRDRAA